MAGIQGPPGYGEHLGTYGEVSRSAGGVPQLGSNQVFRVPRGLQMRSCMEASTLNPSLDLDVSLVGADHQARFLSQVSSSASLLFSSLGASLKSPSLGHQLDSP